MTWGGRGDVTNRLCAPAHSSRNHTGRTSHTGKPRCQHARTVEDALVINMEQGRQNKERRSCNWLTSCTERTVNPTGRLTRALASGTALKAPRAVDRASEAAALTQQEPRDLGTYSPRHLPTDDEEEWQKPGGGVGEKPLTKKSKRLRSRREGGPAERHSNGHYEENEGKQNKKEERFQDQKGSQTRGSAQASAGSQEKKPETLEQTENLKSSSTQS